MFQYKNPIYFEYYRVFNYVGPKSTLLLAQCCIILNNLIMICNSHHINKIFALKKNYKFQLAESRILVQKNKLIPNRIIFNELYLLYYQGLIITIIEHVN